MSVASRVFKGYGNGTVEGTVADRVHKGYSVGEDTILWKDQPDEVTSWADQAESVDVWTDQ